jgi:hypothetical protein
MASIRETPAAAGNTGTQRPLPASGNLSADPRTAAVGEVAASRVVAGEDGVDLLLELAGQRVSVPGRQDLPPGSTLSVRLERTAEGVRLTPVTRDLPPGLPNPVAEALRQALPRQSSLANLLPLLTRLVAAAVPAAAVATPATATPGAPATGLAAGQLPPGAGQEPALASAGDSRTGTGSVAGTTTGPTTRAPASAVDAGIRQPPGPGSAAPAPASPGQESRLQKLPTLEALLGAAPRPVLAGKAPALPAAALAARVVASDSVRSAGAFPGGQPAADAARAGPDEPPTHSQAGIQERGDGSGSDRGAARLARLASAADTLPPRVTAALSALAEQVPLLEDLRDGARLARVVERAGLMLEAHLGSRTPPSGADIAADLKAALLRVRASVEEGGRGREAGAAASAPAVATEAARTALLQALCDSVEGTLARITVNQLQAAAVADHGPLAFSLEIPLRDAEGRYQPLEFEFEREAEESSEQRPPSSTVTLRMEPPGLGPVTAVLRLGGEQLATELWAEQPGTRALLFHTTEQLAAQLRAAGLEVSAIRLSERPPRRAAPSAVAARSLIETQV